MLNHRKLHFDLFGIPLTNTLLLHKTVQGESFQDQNTFRGLGLITQNISGCRIKSDS